MRFYLGVCVSCAPLRMPANSHVSLVVWPAAGFPLMAKRNGAVLVSINREATEFDDIADLVVRNDIGDTLGPFITV